MTKIKTALAQIEELGYGTEALIVKAPRWYTQSPN